MHRVSITATLTKREREALKELARQREQSMSACVRDILRRSLKARGLLNQRRKAQREEIEQ